MVAGASLALACALSIFGIKIKNMNFTAAAAGHPSAADMILSGKPTAALSAYSGINLLPAKYTLRISRCLFEVSSMLTSAKPIPSQRPFKHHKLPSLPSKEDTDSIKPEADFNVQMALKRYQEAAEFSCLNDEHGQISDVLIPLYKAIIYTMLDKDTEAKQCWKQYFKKPIGEGFSFVE
ncbi:hypothetical protein Bca52824_028780 [Brassica carinata]|uniref:Uncharacterized protein n=1 Tax=Brassica carinata TaxID=52824 RepID=A0A8X7VCS6_BRACI|nr:hypothetical protein Bca52824_028780 [Brassica carinata]